MKLRIVTATRGECPYWRETVLSVAAAAPGVEHVVVCPEAKISHVAAAGLEQLPVGLIVPGPFSQLNEAIRVPGDWDAFTWINDDDLLVAPGFSQVVETVARNPDVDIAYGRVDLLNSRGIRIGALPVAHRGDDFGALFARGIIPFAQPGTVIRRKVFERLGGLEESYRAAGDMDFFVRAVVAGMKFTFVDAHVASFRLIAGQLSKKPEGAAEKKRALRPLTDGRSTLAALVRFRLANWRVYLERIRRHGWVSMRELYDHTQ
jgi:hypothetical protein